MTWGVGVFNQGVFLGYFVQEVGWSRAALSIGPALFHLWAGIAGIYIGRQIDRRGPRRVLIVGALSIGCGAIAFGLTRQFWHTYPAFLLLSTGFACLHTVTLGKIVARWFVRQRARAMAAATFGASLGGTILVPLNAAILESWGGLAGGLVLACIAISMVVPLACWVVKDGPETLGLLPDGDMMGADGDEATADATDVFPWTVSEAIRTAPFWALSVSFSLGMIAQGGFLVHQVMFLQSDFGLVGAATVVTVTTITGTLGRLSFAWFGNRWQSRHIASAIFVLQASSLFLSAFAQEAWQFVLGSAIFGFTMGIVVTLQPLTTAECFGRQAFGRIYGSIYFGIRLGSAVGPLIFGLMATATGNYQAVLSLAAAGLLLAAVSVCWAVPTGKRTDAFDAVASKLRNV
jgi:sugar phosphate permease